jgi:hypothetical protein
MTEQKVQAAQNETFQASFQLNQINPTDPLLPSLKYTQTLEHYSLDEGVKSWVKRTRNDKCIGSLPIVEMSQGKKWFEDKFLNMPEGQQGGGIFTNGRVQYTQL